MIGWESKRAMLRVVRVDPEGSEVRSCGEVMYNHAPQHFALHPARCGELCLAAWMVDGSLFEIDWSDDVYDAMTENNFLEGVLVRSLLNPEIPRYVTQRQKTALERAGFYFSNLVLVG